MKAFRTVCYVCLGLFLGCQQQTVSHSKRHLRLAIPAEPSSLDPRKGGDLLSSHLQFFILEGLVKLETDGTVVPAQAHAWTISQDKCIYTFYLGKTRWSDGTKVTSYDFAQTWKSLLLPSFPSPHAHLFYSILHAKQAKLGLCSVDAVGIETPNADTLRITLEKPVPYFLELLSFCAFFPAPPSPSLSNGPFRLDKWLLGEEISYITNTYYHTSRPDCLDAITFYLIENDATAFRLYERGEVDLIGDPFAHIPQEQLLKLSKEELFTIPVFSTLLITFNTHTFPFTNINLRKAFHLAISRKELIDHLLHPGDKIALSLTKTYPLCSDQDIDQARKHLQDALQELQISLPTLEKSLLYLYPEAPLHKKIAQILQQQWKHVLGIHVPLQTMMSTSFLAALSHKQYCFAQTLYRAQYLDPTSILERFTYADTPKNYPSWENTTFQKLLDRSYFMEGQERDALLVQAESLLLQDFPISPLVHTSLLYAKKPYVHHVECSPAGGIFFERLLLDCQ